MNEYGKSNTGTFVNYMTSGTALPIHYTPLPSCVATSDAIWVVQENPEVVQENPEVELKA